jgi:hypothetical protein
MKLRPTSFTNLKCPLHSTQFSSAIAMQEWVGKMKVWRESTTTSPSGMHLGHHKALSKVLPSPSEAPRPGVLTLMSKRQLLLQGQLDLLNYAIRHSYTYNRWKKVATFMIRKDSDSSKVHRLRVIHLYEADLNLLLGVKWRSLIHHCTDHSLLNSGRFGGLPGRDAMTPIFLEELQWETSRASRGSLLRMDFYASSCYDRIIPSIVSLAARSYGQHKALLRARNKTWSIGRGIFPLPSASYLWHRPRWCRQPRYLGFHLQPTVRCPGTSSLRRNLR